MTVNEATANAMACCDESAHPSHNGDIGLIGAERLYNPSSPSSNHGSCQDPSSPARSHVKPQAPGKRMRTSEDGNEVSQGMNKRGKGHEQDDNDDDPHIGKLSKEAEVFALQAIHTSLLQKMSEVGRVLAGVMKENRVYKKVLRDHMGQNEDDIRRVLDIQVTRAMRNQKPQNIGDAEATVIAAAALGKNLNSPADAMEDVLKLYRYAPTPQPKLPVGHLGHHAQLPSRSNSASEGTRA